MLHNTCCTVQVVQSNMESGAGSVELEVFIFWGLVCKKRALQILLSMSSLELSVKGRAPQKSWVYSKNPASCQLPTHDPGRASSPSRAVSGLLILANALQVEFYKRTRQLSLESVSCHSFFPLIAEESRAGCWSSIWLCCSLYLGTQMGFPARISNA